MKKLFFLMLGFLTALPTFARNFQYEYRGQTLTYRVISESDKTCRVSQSPDWKSISGDVFIPATVSNGTDEYTVTGIEAFTFYNCVGITSIDIPNTVTEIYNYAFCSCHGLTSLVIPNSVTLIEEAAFGGCKGLRSVVIGSSVATIGKDAFAHCTALTSVEFSGNLVKIGDAAFYGCTKLESIDIPATVTTIGDDAFGYCDGLTSVYIPASVTSIGYMAFTYCSRLEDINVDEDNPEYSSIDGVLLNRDGTILIAFPTAREGDYSIPATVNIIGETAFQGSKLTSVTIPGSVTTIAETAFFNCELPSIIIPATVTIIGTQAFLECLNLTSVYYEAEDPGEFDWLVFGEYTYNAGTLYVPEAAVEKCKQINPWMNFGTIQAYDFNGVEDVLGDDELTGPCETFTTGGIKIAGSKETLLPGVYIMSDGATVKKILVK